MTSAEIVTIISALGVVIVNVIVAWRTGAKVEAAQANATRHDIRSDERAQAVQATTTRAAAMTDQKLDAIHELANSRLAAVLARVAELEALLGQRAVSGEG